MNLRITGTLRRGDLTLDLDLDLGVGTTAVVGPNGSGKSSVLRLIAGLEALDDGRMEIDGNVVDDPRVGRFVPPEHRAVALAFQQPRLFPHLSVLDNIVYPLRRRPKAARLPADLAEATARSHAERVGVSALLDLRPARLSGGQAQRAALAVVTVTGADTILLDEPLASIDENGRADIRRVLRHLDAPRVVWVTHDPADAEGADSAVDA